MKQNTRLAILLSIFSFCIGCAGSKHATTSSVPKDLDGVWYPVTEEMGGKALPVAAFGKQKLTLHDSTYALEAESLDKGVVKYSRNNMDIFGREGVNSGRHFTAIYKKEGEQLTICYNLAGDGYPTSFETTGKPLYFLAVFKRTPAPAAKQNAAPPRFISSDPPKY